MNLLYFHASHLILVLLLHLKGTGKEGAKSDFEDFPNRLSSFTRLKTNTEFNYFIYLKFYFEH